MKALSAFSLLSIAISMALIQYRLAEIVEVLR